MKDQATIWQIVRQYTPMILSTGSNSQHQLTSFPTIVSHQPAHLSQSPAYANVYNCIEAASEADGVARLREARAKYHLFGNETLALRLVIASIVVG
jgi:hypothetical protein